MSSRKAPLAADLFKATCGGKRSGNTGYSVEPTVLVKTSPDMKVYREEIFGPVVTAVPFKSADDDLVTRANDTTYGLAAGIYTRDMARAHRIANRLRAGVHDSRSAGSPQLISSVHASWARSENGFANGASPG